MRIGSFARWKKARPRLFDSGAVHHLSTTWVRIASSHQSPGNRTPALWAWGECVPFGDCSFGSVAVIGPINSRNLIRLACVAHN